MPERGGVTTNVIREKRNRTWANSAMLLTLCHKLLFIAQLTQEIDTNRKAKSKDCQVSPQS